MMSFRAFWPRYVRAHRHRGTRIGHYCATAIALWAVAASIALHAGWLLVVGVLLGYGIALASHRIGAASQSLVLVNPVWGAVADLKMCWLALTGQLGDELQRHAGPAEMEESLSSPPRNSRPDLIAAAPE